MKFEIKSVSVNILMSLCLLTAGTWSMATAGEPTSSEAKPPVEVFTKSLQIDELYDASMFGGFIETLADFIVLSEQAGIVEKVHVQAGQRVTKGQVLFTVRPLAGGMNFREYRVASPATGELSFIDVRVGERVESGAELTRIAQTDRLQITVEVTRQDLEAVESNVPSEVIVGYGTASEKKVPARMMAFSKRARKETGTFPVTMALICTNEFKEVCENHFLVGTLARVVLKKNERQGILVPVAHLFEQRRKAILLTSELQAKWVEVELGSYYGDQVEVISGLKAGDVIVTSSAKRLDEGDLVVVVNSDGSVISKSENREAEPDAEKKS